MENDCERTLDVKKEKRLRPLLFLFFHRFSIQ